MVSKLIFHGGHKVWQYEGREGCHPKAHKSLLGLGGVLQTKVTHVIFLKTSPLIGKIDHSKEKSQCWKTKSNINQLIGAPGSFLHVWPIHAFFYKKVSDDSSTRLS